MRTVFRPGVTGAQSWETSMHQAMPRVAELLREWRDQYRPRGDTEEAAVPLREIVVANEASIRWALDTVGDMSNEQKIALYQQHPSLNVPGGVAVDYARHLVDSLTNPGDDWHLENVDDHVNVLTRVLGYAEFAD
jgi:hypothetical protein